MCSDERRDCTDDSVEGEADISVSRHERARQALRAIIHERGLSRLEVAEAVGASIKAVHSWLLPERSPAARVMPDAKLRLLDMVTAHRKTARTDGETTLSVESEDDLKDQEPGYCPW